MNIGFSKEHYAIPSLNGDTRDCMVRALAVSVGIPYIQAQELYRVAGRMKGQGASVAMLRAILRQHLPGFNEQYFARPQRMTLQQMMLFGYFAKGRFIVITDHHALSVVDGVVHDWGLHKKYRVIYTFQV